MKEQLREALEQVEKNCDKYNEFYFKGELKEAQKYKLAAYDAIANYIVETKLQIGEIDRENFSTTYLKGGLEAVSDLVERLHKKIRTIQKPDNESLSLDVFILFYSLDIVLYDPDYINSKKIVYVDMDNVIVDFASAFPLISDKIMQEYDSHKDDIPGIFGKMKPLPDAIEAMKVLYKYFDVYILSTSPWHNDGAWKDKVMWVKKHLPIVGYKRLILSHHKELNACDYIIDDRNKNGVARFKGEHIYFGTSDFPNWKAVLDYLLPT